MHAVLVSVQYLPVWSPEYMPSLLYVYDMAERHSITSPSLWFYVYLLVSEIYSLTLLLKKRESELPYLFE